MFCGQFTFGLSWVAGSLSPPALDGSTNLCPATFIHVYSFSHLEGEMKKMLHLELETIISRREKGPVSVNRRGWSFGGAYSPHLWK